MKKIIFLLTSLLFMTTAFYGQGNYNDFNPFENQIIFFDEFNDNSNEWYNKDISVKDLHTEMINGYFLIKNKTQNAQALCKEISLDESKDFEIEAEIKMVGGSNLEKKGSCLLWGFNLSSQIDNENFVEISTQKMFGFQISPTGYYKIFKRTGGKDRPIIDFQMTDKIDKAGYNKITIRKINNRYFFFLNETFLCTTKFESFFGQAIGFHSSSNTVIQIDYLKVSYLNSKTSRISSPIANHNDNLPQISEPMFDSNIIKDNFESGSINTTLWEVTGVHVKQEGGIIKLEQNVTDQPTSLTSKWLPFDTRRSIKITRNVKIHRGSGKSNDYYYGGFGMSFDNANSINIQYLYSKYNDKKYTPLKEGIFLQTTFNKNFTEKRLSANLWDQWFKETLIFTPTTGELSYYLNDVLVSSYKTEVILSGNNHVKLSYSPSGWWTGHYQYIDNLEVTYDGTGLPLISWITPSSSFVETTDLPYTIKAIIQSEKQIRSVKLMSGESTLASENSFSLINGQNSFEKNIELIPGSNELSIIAENEYGQVISTKRTVKYDAPQAPPLLLLSDIIFTDQNGNNRIDGNEECYIKFSISNKGKGPAHNLQVILRNNSEIKGLSFNSMTPLGSISQNAQQNVIIPISGIMDLTTGILNLNISFTEQRGFPPDPVDMQIETKAFVKPDIRIVDYSFLTDNGSIKLGYPIQLKVLVQNVGQGIGDNVSVKFQYPTQNVFLNGPKDFQIGTMLPGSTKELVFEFIANKLYSEANIPITVKLSEKYGKFSQERMVSATLASKSAGNTIAVKSNTSENIINIEVASLSADVDKYIPQNAIKHPFRYALIIGNEDYSSRQRTLGSEVNVAFAINDAKTFKEYAINTFGVEEQNSMFLTNATAGEISQKIELISQILSRLGEKGELIFYYAGHGFPDENTKIPYLMPVDVSATNLQSAIKLSDLYQKLSQTKAKQITIFLDACFTGGGRDQGLLAARGVRIKPLNDHIAGNMVVFAATSEDQSALPYTEKQHGIFTYYLLKKLQETKGDVSYEELSNYLKTNVSLESLRINNKPQDPSILISTDVQNTWNQWRIK